MNRVFLMGVVSAMPIDEGSTVTVEIGVPEKHRGREWLQRFEFVARGPLAEVVRSLRPAQEVFADGRVAVHAGRPVIEGRTVIMLSDTPAPPGEEHSSEGTHSSPRPHDRVGHPRRIHAGTAAERVVWVRATRVGQPPPVASR